MPVRGKNAGNRGQGSKWLSKKKRAAIYERDEHRCVWCGSTEELTVDHLEPRSLGGTNDITNLATACMRHNRERGNRSSLLFAVHLSFELKQAPALILERVYRQVGALV